MSIGKKSHLPRHSNSKTEIDVPDFFKIAFPLCPNIKTIYLDTTFIWILSQYNCEIHSFNESI